MSRTCPKCGWVYPSSYTRSDCRFCRTRFSTQICWICKQESPTEEFAERKAGKNKGYLQRTCSKCSAKYQRDLYALYPDSDRESCRRYYRKISEQAKLQYEEWMDMSKIDFKPMSENEWLSVCAYFEGCAICGEEHIETRQFLVPFKDGGRYASWNILPMCEKCSGVAKKYDNPFRWLHKSLGNAYKMGLTDERKNKILEYFILQMERCKNNESTPGSV